MFLNNSHCSLTARPIRFHPYDLHYDRMQMFPRPWTKINSVDDFSTNVLAAQQYDWRIRSRDHPIAELEDKELWLEFYSKMTEMVITKTGRRMFPAFKVRIKGLDPSAKYVLLLDIVLSNENRYKYYHNQWIKSGKAELNHHLHSPYIHPDSPSSGEEWMGKPISFHKIKLSNTRVDKEDVIILNSMHKYIPKLYLVRAQNLLHTNYCHWEEFSFEETQFIAVTAYQNDQITKLKINYNPFAKGFRESAYSKKEKRNSLDMEYSNQHFIKSSPEPNRSDYIVIKNKILKQISVRNKALRRTYNVSMPPFDHIPLLFDHTDLKRSSIEMCNNVQSKKSRTGFLISELLDDTV